MAEFENCQSGTEAKFINKSSLFILSLGVIRRLDLKPNSEQKVEYIRRPAILPSNVSCRFGFSCGIAKGKTQHQNSYLLPQLSAIILTYPYESSF